MELSLLERLLAIEEQIREISAYGNTYCKNAFDLENYEKLSQISITLLELLTNNNFQQMTKAQKRVLGRPTPLIIVDAAITNSENQILLIRRTDSGRWAFPGGHLNIGETISNGVRREVLEEVGLSVIPMSIVGVYDNGLEDSNVLIQSYTILLLCNLPNDQEKHEVVVNPDEVLTKKWIHNNAIRFLKLDQKMKLRMMDVHNHLEGNVQAVIR
ncbi:MAG: NUDIX hydrolase N-terminal domain-containing protein [Syntrophomonas sp.]|jgi:ADP-ribose pyrophosphatase YjhB (NUDIX family)